MGSKKSSLEKYQPNYFLVVKEGTAEIFSSLKEPLKILVLFLSKLKFLISLLLNCCSSNPVDVFTLLSLDPEFKSTIGSMEVIIANEAKLRRASGFKASKGFLVHEGSLRKFLD